MELKAMEPVGRWRSKRWWEPAQGNSLLKTRSFGQCSLNGPHFRIWGPYFHCLCIAPKISGAMLRVPWRRIWIPRSSAADTSMRCHLQLLKLHNICYWDHGGWQSLSESRSAVILRVAPKCRSELSSCLPMWHPPILGNLLILQQIRITNK